MFDFYLNVIVGGLLIGLVYALVAAGLTIIFGVMRLVNFAHGEMVVFGMYVGILCWKVLGLSALQALPIAVALAFVAGYLLQRFVVSDFMARPQHAQFILFIGLALLITGIHAVTFGPDPQGSGSASSFKSIRLGSLNLDRARVEAAAGSVCLIALLTAFLRYTRAGIAIRAAADNRVGAAAVGLRIPATYALVSGIGVACASAAGVLISPMFPAQPYIAGEFTLLAFITVIVGGLGSLPGALLGGLLIGVAESVAALLISPSMKTMLSYAILIAVILVRPQGIFGGQRS